MLSAFCCTFGCLFQGFAQDVRQLYVASIVLALGAVNFWNVVGAYVALATPREQRHVVVTGFQVRSFELEKPMPPGSGVVAPAPGHLAVPWPRFKGLW